MQRYHYLATDQNGHRLRGEMLAVDVDALAERLLLLGQDLIRAKVKKHHFSLRGTSISPKQHIDWLFSLERLLHAGVPLLTALADIAKSIEHPPLRAVLEDCHLQLSEGQTFAAALASHPRLFNAITLQLVTVGEQSGAMSSMLAHITAILKWEDELRAKTRKILLYPCIVGVVTLSASLFLLLVLVPALRQLILSLANGQSLPWQTEFLFGLATVVSQTFMFIPILLVLAWLSLIVIAKSERFCYRRDQLILKLPLIGSLLHRIALLRFAEVWSHLYSAGLPIQASLVLCQGMLTNSYARSLVSTVRQEIEGGRMMADAFDDPFFLPLFRRMIQVGSDTGRLDETLDNCVYFFDRDINERLANIQTLVEPILMLLFGGLLVFMMTAVFLPIYDVLGKM